MAKFRLERTKADNLHDSSNSNIQRETSRTCISTRYKKSPARSSRVLSLPPYDPRLLKSHLTPIENYLKRVRKCLASRDRASDPDFKLASTHYTHNHDSINPPLLRPRKPRQPPRPTNRHRITPDHRRDTFLRATSRASTLPQRPQGATLPETLPSAEPGIATQRTRKHHRHYGKHHSSDTRRLRTPRRTTSRKSPSRRSQSSSTRSRVFSLVQPLMQAYLNLHLRR